MNKKSIIIIGDVPDWAFGNIIKWVRDNLSGVYEIYYDFLEYNGWDKRADWAEVACPWSDVAMRPGVASRRLIKWYRGLKNPKRRIKLGLKPHYDCVVFLDYYMDRKANFSFSADHVVRGIYTDVFPPFGLEFDRKLGRSVASMGPVEFVSEYFSDADALLLGSPFMLEFYKQYFRNVFFANLVYDDAVFAPFSPGGRVADRFVIGWTGNPSRPWKGFKEIVEPAVAIAAKMHGEIVLKTRFEGPMDTLHEFYRDVDLVCIASSGDAGPSMFTEASLSGIPSISTRIGFPSVVIDSGVNGMIVERSVDAFVEAILLMFRNRDLHDAMRSRIREDYIASLGREVMLKSWRRLFDFVLSQPGRRRSWC